MNIVMIRHLPTQWNMKGVLQGSKDIALAEISSESKEQIIANKKQLADKYGDFEHVFESICLCVLARALENMLRLSSAKPRSSWQSTSKHFACMNGLRL